MELPISSNGPAYVTREVRKGIPLDYLSEKLSHAIRETHSLAQRFPQMLTDLVPVMHYQITTLLALHSMLGAANDARLPERLLGSSRQNLENWLDIVARQGDVLGISDS
jgi:hypothetical protein